MKLTLGTLAVFVFLVFVELTEGKSKKDENRGRDGNRGVSGGRGQDRGDFQRGRNGEDFGRGNGGNREFGRDQGRGGRDDFQRGKNREDLGRGNGQNGDFNRGQGQGLGRDQALGEGRGQGNGGEGRGNGRQGNGAGQSDIPGGKNGGDFGRGNGRNGDQGQGLGTDQDFGRGRGRGNGGERRGNGRRGNRRGQGQGRGRGGRNGQGRRNGGDLGQGFGNEFDVLLGEGPRVRRASPNNIRGLMQGLGNRINFRMPGGKAYTWKRELGFGYSVDEAAFAHLEKNTAIVLSFDNALDEYNTTQATTIYDFTGTSGIVVIKPRRQPMRCYLMETSQTYDEIIMEMDIRNGSSVSTNQFINLDGTGTPLTDNERKTILQANPSLRRPCYRRDFVWTRPLGLGPVTFDGETKDMKVMTLDAIVTLTVPAQPQLLSSISDMFPRRRGRGKGQGRLRNMWNRLTNGNQGTGTQGA